MKNPTLGEEERSLICLNLGSGQNGLASWINVDIGTKYTAYRFLPIFRFLRKIGLISQPVVSWIEDTGKPPPNLHRWNLTKRIPMPDSTCDFIYCAEVIEHLKVFEARNLVHECYRLLKRGGVLRVTVPDVSELCSLYLNKNYTLDQFNELFFSSSYYKQTLIERFGAAIYSTKYHQWMYDYEEMYKLLDSAGFVRIVKRGPASGSMKDVELLERDYSTKRPYCLYVEATKN